MFVTFNDQGMPLLGGVDPGAVLKRCTILFKADRNGQLIPGSGTATVEVTVPGSSRRQRYTDVPLRFK
jgi:hypothetical protein